MKKHIKQLFFLMMFVSVVTYSVPAHAATNGTDVRIISKVFDEKTFSGYVINNRTYVDLTGLLNCLPYNNVNSKAISFDAKLKTLKIFSNDFADNTTPLLQFHVGDDYFTAGNDKIKMDSKVLIVNNRIFIPLKPVVSYYKLTISWNQKDKTTLVEK